MQPKIKIKKHDWRLDIDYMKSLSEEDRAYLLKFLDNFYQGANHDGVQSTAQNKESWRDNKRQSSDLLNKLSPSSSRSFDGQLPVCHQRAVRAPSKYKRRLGPEDYKTSSASPEDAIVEVIDRKTA